MRCNLSISDLSCSSPPTISLTNGIFITEREPNTLSCTASHQANEIENVYFVNSDGNDVLADATLNPIVTEEFVNGTENSIYSLKLLWTNDTVLKKKLDSLHCVVIYRSGSQICKSSNIHIVFLGMCRQYYNTIIISERLMSYVE